MNKLKVLTIALTSTTALTACYVVPINQVPVSSGNTYPTAAVVIARPIYTARLYPTNDLAASIGRVSGTISNPERGQGEFSFVMAGENYVGEATRASGSNRGIANAAGNRGGYAKCSYTMSTTMLGTGSCMFSSGAAFDLHVSQ